jgi:hypothetical protein
VQDAPAAPGRREPKGRWRRVGARVQAERRLTLLCISAGTAVLEEAEAARAEGSAAAGTSKRRKGAAADAANGSAAASDGAHNGSVATGSGTPAPGAVKPPSQQLLAGHRQCVAALAWQEEATVVSGSWDHSVRSNICGFPHEQLQQEMFAAMAADGLVCSTI